MTLREVCGLSTGADRARIPDETGHRGTADRASENEDPRDPDPLGSAAGKAGVDRIQVPFMACVPCVIAPTRAQRCRSFSSAASSEPAYHSVFFSQNRRR